MTASMYSFSDVERNKATSRTINDRVKELLRAGAYEQMEAYIKPPGVAGTANFDHLLAVLVLLDFDSKTNARFFTKSLKETPMTHADIWQRIQAVLKQVGFSMRRGRLMGLLSDESESTGKIEGNTEAA